MPMRIALLASEALLRSENLISKATKPHHTKKE